MTLWPSSHSNPLPGPATAVLTNPLASAHAHLYYLYHHLPPVLPPTADAPALPSSREAAAEAIGPAHCRRRRCFRLVPRRRVYQRCSGAG